MQVTATHMQRIPSCEPVQSHLDKDKSSFLGRVYLLPSRVSSPLSSACIKHAALLYCLLQNLLLGFITCCVFRAPHLPTILALANLCAVQGHLLAHSYYWLNCRDVCLSWLDSGGWWKDMGGLQPLEVAIFWPSQSVGWDRGGKPLLCGPGGLSAHVEQSL